ncbi:TrkA family potassium uptake protein [candidate division KSB1 bacterium]|nr:TrkA family potassium uptake protein [candidate division KSB1 bacterium]NIR72687.1 TrkA family potassium uptake protein [candidate division KSB1 bacterium]NIS28214.1 TrkA family potassium uptake protein [candidate division KSB1 bacterium]NIT75104.1 TrkA family potassium uptake protein [candidate division KSB1 bacterium]NIU28890.1 TrkA family potassium uptake protein [candidate division KSB1 bacterium]
MKNFVIIGLSTFGYYMAQFLSERNFDVIAIDSDEGRVEAVKPYVTKGIIADARDMETLKKLGVTETDAVIVSLGESIDASLLVVLHLKELGIEEIFVKVLTEDHAKIVNIIGASEIVFPERDSAFKLAQRIDNPNILEYVPLTEGYSVIDLAPPESFTGKTLRELDLRNEYEVQVIIIKEMVPERVIIPTANHVVKDSDLLVVMGKNEDLERLKKIE